MAAQFFPIWRAVRSQPARTGVLLVAILAIAASRAWSLEFTDPHREPDVGFRAELESLAARCDELGLDAQAAISRNWYPDRDPRRHYLFLPAAEDLPRAGPHDSRLIGLWHERFVRARGQRAAWLFDAARDAAQAGDEATAYRTLHEVLREDPDHVQARRILADERQNRGGERKGLAPRTRPTRAPHPLFGWPAKEHWRVESEHFEVTTNAGARAGRQVAEYLERVHAAWRQLFYEYWSIPGRLTARFDGQDVPLGPPRTYRVVLFKDRDEYLQQLGGAEPQIALTVGYYAQHRKISFFYAGDDTVRMTWVHEATHQFFQESGEVAPLVGEHSNFWIVEGIALYMESLADHGDYLTIGGVDADRLQFARYRLLNEGYYIPLETLVTFGRARIQRDERIREIYSQCAGLAHFLMHPPPGTSMRPVVDYLRIVYRGVSQPSTLAEQLGQNYSQLDQAYRESLRVTDQDLAFVDRRARNLCLSHTAVTDQGLARLSGMDQLEWLDLSFTSIGDEGLVPFSAAMKLNQLNLEATRLTDAGLDVVAQFRQLEELDLSQTAIGDDGVAKLAPLTRLKILWLTGTSTSDAGLSVLSSLRNLEQLDVSGTRVTRDALDSLKKRLPRLKS